MKKILFTLALTFIGLQTTISQVGIGTTNPDNAAALDITSTDKGLLPPRMTENDRDNISTPPAGLQIWCTNCGSNGEMQVYNGTEWTNITGGPAAVHPPQVGDFRDGGVVFYVAPTPTDLDGDGTLDQGLVCAVDDQSSDAEWGCPGTFISGAGSNGIGSGADNTSAILANCSQSGIAAELCDNYTGGGYSGWFLPSKDELNEMYQNKATIDATAVANGGSGFASAYYWSSTDGNQYDVWEQNFDSGFQGTNWNYATARVRAIRAF